MNRSIFNKIVVLLFSLMCMTSLQAHIQSDEKAFSIEWGISLAVKTGENVYTVPCFRGAIFKRASIVPIWQSIIDVENVKQISLNHCVYAPLSLNEKQTFDSINISQFVNSVLSFKEVTIEKESKTLAQLFPFTRDSLTGELKKLVSFTLMVVSESDSPSNKKSVSFASQSQLSAGSWYKLGIAKSGVYRITYQDLIAMNIKVADFNPSTFGIFGGNGQMQAEKNALPRIDDIQELAIQVSGQDDGRFDTGDEIIFYANGPDSYKYNSFYQLWEGTRHLYSDTIYYFFTPDRGTNKRLASAPSSTAAATHTVNEYDYYTSYNKDEFNLIRSGRLWFGELFDVITIRNVPFDIPELTSAGILKFKTLTAATSIYSSSFTFGVGNQSWNVQHFPTSSSFNAPAASGSTFYKTLTGVQLPLNVEVKYNKPVNDAKAYLDQIIVTARCNLAFTKGQMLFCDPTVIGNGNIANYSVKNAASKATIWDVTDPFNSMKIIYQIQGIDAEFRLTANEIRHFIAFDNSSLLSPTFIRKVANQNLHALSSVDMIIVSPEEFLPQAIRLATFHSTQSDLNVSVVQLDAIYNEFSAGTPDITAIRDFTRMLYEKASPGAEPDYLLLFGDGSYDYKDKTAGNTNFVPAWQSQESFDPISSSTTDDFFGFLDPEEGISMFDKVDIGIGRLPVRSLIEAEKIVDKLINYSNASITQRGDWQNVVTFVADDDDEKSNDHIRDSELLAAIVSEQNSGINIEKIYMDSYVQVAVPNGTRYPEVNKAITQRIENGSLIVNYIGHGGETGWSHEEILTTPEINNWENIANMPVFLTATCEFSRFDDPGRVAAGEWVLLNPKGGGVALFTTTRPTYGEQNFDLNKSFFEYAIPKTGDVPMRMGDIIKKSKQSHGSDENGRKFVLLGDPAQYIAYPKYQVVTTRLNSAPVTENDTLKAFMEVTLEGEIQDNEGNILSDFTGKLLPSVFDKPIQLKTLANDGGSVYSFSVQKNLIYRGKVNVVNGKFSFTFVVPKDISYRIDKGKVSYFATDGVRDASGFYCPYIGGSFQAIKVDENGPDIKLYMNDTRFIDGGLTDQNPWLIVKVSDESGINTIGNGIGHDLTAVLDNVTSSPYILNDFYESDEDTYKSGTIRFPFSMLSTGEHVLRVKVWDIYNNSSEAEIRFTVFTKNSFIIKRAYSYPNPFSETTHIVFEHNQKNVTFTQKAEIFDFSGKRVKVIESSEYQNGSISAPMLWDGTDETGNAMPSGLYIFRLVIFTSDGMYNETTGKMIRTN